MIYIASALTYYEGETLLGAFNTLERAKNCIARQKKKHEWSDEFVVYAMPHNKDTTNHQNIVWSSNKEI